MEKPWLEKLQAYKKAITRLFREMQVDNIGRLQFTIKKITFAESGY
ncbi:hypothetical protein [Heyndrickxia coagulans]|uniref:Uncharacterized protein n=1 Tax=Heyndrickxia coagulans TaxID=1398 RepID=A0AAW7C8T1_HEYCO|nr:hypothetical protein [Heyndrickxia coagulans]MDL5039628.1 hypothetical protein [Heyndrickxia coagulans]